MALTPTGLERPRLADLKFELDASVTSALGPVNTSPDAVLGQLNGIHAAALDDCWEVLDDVYNSAYPATAEGINLDRAVSLLGVVRIPAAPVVVTAAVYGDEGSIVPANAVAHADIQYFNTSDVTITASRLIDVRVEVFTLVDSTVYSITLNGVVYSINSGIGATDSSILSALATAITGYTKIVKDDVLRISASDGQTPFTYAKSANLNTVQMGSPAIFVSIASGARELPIGSLADIDTPVFGWTAISNLIPGAGSRDIESDADLRLRHSTVSRVAGSATVTAIRSRLLQEVAGVTTVNVFENRTHVFVDSMPPHSFEAIVRGGSDQAVARNIWENKPAGIETYGNVSIEVNDDNGDLQPINFSRASSIYVWIRVTVTQLYPEETLPGSTIQAIKDAVYDTGNKLDVGEDIINQRFIGPIYINTSGLGMVTIESAVTSTEGGTPVYSTTNKAISRNELPIFSIDRITVVGL